MNTNSTNQPEEDFQPESDHLAGKERTKRFLKKLEIQHKLLQKMIDQETTVASPYDVKEDQGPGMQHDEANTEQ